MAFKLNKTLCAMMVSTALLGGCNDSDNHVTNTPTNTQQPDNGGQSQTVNSVKNVIMILGDGMGPGQLGLLEEYATRAPASIYNGHPTAINTFHNKGLWAYRPMVQTALWWLTQPALPPNWLPVSPLALK